jgi:hypothetical protein
MSDEIDIANDRRDAELANRISEFQYQLNHAVSAFETGRCRNCETKTDDSRAFCDSECMKDWEYRQKMSKRVGR